jgi:hypothetical protein
VAAHFCFLHGLSDIDSPSQPATADQKSGSLNGAFDGERLIERYFHLAENQKPPARAAWRLTTFLTMAYIIVVNPQILAQACMPAETWCLLPASPPPLPPGLDTYCPVHSALFVSGCGLAKKSGASASFKVGRVSM